MTNGQRLCRAYYGAQDEADVIYYTERDYWDHLAKAALVAFANSDLQAKEQGE